MVKKVILILLMLTFSAGAAMAQLCGAYPYTLTNGTSADANQVMANLNSILNCVNALSAPFPASFGGRLTLQSGVPVMTSSSTLAQTLYYAPYSGSSVPIYNGAVVQAYPFTSGATDAVGLQLSLSDSPNWAANTVFDVFVALNAGSPALCTGPSWTNATTRATAGSIARYNGIWVNSSATALACRTSSTVINVPQYQATYVGTIMTDAAQAGAVDYTFGGAASGGSPAVFGVWNYYNRVDVASAVTDNGASYTYTGSFLGWRSARGSQGNRISFVVGLNEDALSVSYITRVGPVVATSYGLIGIGLDSTSSVVSNADLVPGTTTGSSSNIDVYFSNVSSPGQHYLQALESGDGVNANYFNYNYTGVLGFRFKM
jgi:hypothetical protein